MGTPLAPTGTALTADYHRQKATNCKPAVLRQLKHTHLAADWGALFGTQGLGLPAAFMVTHNRVNSSSVAVCEARIQPDQSRATIQNLYIQRKH